MDGVRMEESLGEGFSDAADMSTEEVMPMLRESILPAATQIVPAIADGITTTAPGHADLLTGRRHPFGNLPVEEEAGPGAYLALYPTLFDSLPAGESTLVTNGLLVSQNHRSVATQGHGGAEVITVFDDEAVLRTVREQLIDGDRLIVANLHESDALGHYGASEAYGEQVQVLDDQLSIFWTWLQEQDRLAPQTTLILVADHGRHRVSQEDEDPWRGHGDQCYGCREIPMILLGAGVIGGQRLERPYNLQDLAQTIAGVLEVSLPYSDGLPIQEAFADELPASRTGILDAVSTGSGSAVQRLGDTPEQRSIIEVDGEQVSSDTALAAESPDMVSNDVSDFVCWRELEPSTDMVGWEARCLYREIGGEWEDIGSPESPVWPMWEPGLQISSEGLQMAWIRNPNGTAALMMPIILSRWSPERGWDELATVPAGLFPNDVALAGDVDRQLLAWTSSPGDDGLSVRSERSINLHSLTSTTGEDRQLLRVVPADSGSTNVDFYVEGQRLERPALWSSGDEIRLAWLSYTADTASSVVSVWQTFSEDAGESWSTPERLDQSGQVFGHTGPVYLDGVVYWLEGSHQEASMCSVKDCESTDTPYVDRLRISDGRVSFSAAQDGVWETR